ncbi:MAG: PrpF family protein [Acidimicrobiaceae bacterium]|nr:PrpF family protein [Acidimicrobiaceae bacterium]
MRQRSLPAVFMRGGTSKGLMFHASDLPSSQAKWPPLLTAAMGSPDPYGRQLDGMGGGISSLSKACVVAPSQRADADVDYTFVQVLIREGRLDLASNCGNMSSAVGPFAVDEGLVRVRGDSATLRIFNTNTSKVINATFPIEETGARYDGALAIPGVAGSGAPIRLDFVEPGGATTGSLLPTGQVCDRLEVTRAGGIEVSLVDAGNATVFVRAIDVGLTGLELPDELDARPDVLALLEDIRRQAAVRMGIAAEVSSVPFVCIVRTSADAATLSGQVIPEASVDLISRAISNGQPHRALPLTVSLCTAVAAKLAGSIVSDAVSSTASHRDLSIGMPSGVLRVDADVAWEKGQWVAKVGSFYRTARRLFDGRVWIPGQERPPHAASMSDDHDGDLEERT